MKPKITIKLGARPSSDEGEGESGYDDGVISDIADMLKDMKAAMDGDDFEEAARLFCAAQDLHGSGGSDE
jgi:hypothetical protein